MSSFPRPVRIGLALAGAAALIFAGVELWPLAREWIAARHATAGHHEVDAEGPRVELVENRPDTLRVPDDVARSLGIAVSPARGSLPPQPLELDGTLFLDTNSMVHVHSRFSGDVVEVGDLEISPPQLDGDEGRPSDARTLQYGDRVRKGQILAVVWSKELGEKKSELVEYLSKLRLSQLKLQRLETLLEKGSVPETQVRDGEREVESNTISVARAERTLRSWQLSDSEIEAIYAEALKIHERSGRGATKSDPGWARVEIKAPITGTIVEKNIAVGDYIDNDLDIFKIADLSRMDVLAHAYEEDLPALERLPLAERHWKILLKADPKTEPVDGRFDRIGNIIDPSQHTALVMGWVNNSSGRLRIGQFVTARVELPNPPDEVAVPVGALIDLDGESFVFTRVVDAPDQYTRRRVYPVRRFDDFMVVDCSPHPQSGPTSCATEALRPGELVVSTAGIQLCAELISLQSAARVKRSPAP